MRVKGIGLKRSIFSSQLGPELDGREEVLFGWVMSVRDQGGIKFIIISDKDGIAQITVKKGEVGKRIWERAKRIREHSCIGVRGIVRKTEKAPHGAEIVPKELRVYSVPKKLPPFPLFGSSLPKLDKRLDIRAVDLRRPRAQAIFKIRGSALRAIRDYLHEEGFLEVNTPKIIASATEGGAALFPLLYYDKEAFLTQSPQLYKEQLVMAFERVFEIAPAFRAEPSKTLSHLSEFLSVDVECAFVDMDGAMEILEGLIGYVVHRVREECKEQFELLGFTPEVPSDMKRITYDEAVELARRHGVDVDWGEDLSSIALDAIASELKGYYFITGWPEAIKPFYIKPRKDGRSESFDLMYGDLEIASGGERIASKRELMRRIRSKGLNPKSFEYHLKVFDYGMPPHSGWGLGFDRFMMVLTGQKNVREVTLFPRDQFRLTP